MRLIIPYLFLALVACNKPAEEPRQEPVSDSKPQQTSSPGLKSGDIIFQSSNGGQGKAIQLATGSKYNHVGIIFEQQGKYFVYEAVQPVKVTPLKEWIQRGDKDHYVVKRLKEEKKLTSEVLVKMWEEGQKHLGKNYDLYFEWSDKKLYCSELVWKIYKEGAGIEIGKLQQLKDFNLSHPIVKYKLKERYGDKIPYGQEVISPAAIYECPLLEEIVRE